MKRYTSMKVGGPAKYLYHPEDEEDVVAAIDWLTTRGFTVRFLGNGTNVIVADRGLEMGVVRTTRMRRLRFHKVPGGALVDAAGGLSLRVLIRECARRGLSGLERLYGIPGTVGGAIKMNAGSFGVSISASLKSVRTADGDGVKTVRREEMEFAYRRSSFTDGECILSATFEVVDRDPVRIEAEMEDCWQQRMEKHPMEYPSAGSVFKNSSGPAWQIIDAAGLRGLRMGGACVSGKHSNFIINTGGATAQDVKRLIDTVKKSVHETKGIDLEEEVELWGFDEDDKRP